MIVQRFEMFVSAETPLEVHAREGSLTAEPAGCGVCLMEDRSGVLIADDAAGVFGWAWCSECGERAFIPRIAQLIGDSYGTDLVFSIDRTGPLPMLMELS